MERLFPLHSRRRAGLPKHMPQSEPLETAFMFWAGGDPAQTIAELANLGIRSGQIGIPDDLDLGCAPQWREALRAADFRIHTVLADYNGESYADIPTVQ